MATCRRICVVTGSRAEYGILYWLLREIAADATLELQLVATAMHLSPEFGLTYRQIEQDGFKIDAKVEMLLSSDTAVGIAKSIGIGIVGFADALDRLKPDMLVLAGDRLKCLRQRRWHWFPHPHRASLRRRHHGRCVRRIYPP